MKPGAIHVSKLDAARRQLRTAIRLWFYDGDPVSIHTLAYAAYEVIHAISKKRNPKRELLFDAKIVKEEYRSLMNRALKYPANFFKHANKVDEEVIEFHPKLSELFIIFAIHGVGACGEVADAEESAFWMWMALHEPDFLLAEGKKLLAERIPVEGWEMLRHTKKDEFLEMWFQARALNARKSRGHI
jgi:hypothetical protein